MPAKIQTLKAGQFAIKTGKMKIEKTSLQFSKLSNGDIEMTMKFKFSPAQLGPKTGEKPIEKSVGDCGIFTLDTKEHFRSGSPNLNLSNSASNVISFTSDNLRVKTDGQKGEHGQTK